jgi:hypothetical protein
MADYVIQIGLRGGFRKIITLKTQIQKISLRLLLLNSFQNLLSSSLLSENVKIIIHKTIILPVVLYGCETWSLILNEEHRRRIFQNWVLKRIFGTKDEIIGGWKNA